MQNIRGVPPETSFFFNLDPRLCYYNEDGSVSDEPKALGLFFRYSMRTAKHLHYGPKDAGAKAGVDQAKQYSVMVQLGEVLAQELKPTLIRQRLGDNQLCPQHFHPWRITQADRQTAGYSTGFTLNSANVVEGLMELKAASSAGVSLARRMFLTEHWPKGEVARPRVQLQEGDGAAKKKYSFSVINHTLCWERTVKTGGETVLEHQQLTNFEFYNYKAIYQFGDDTPPHHVIQCRWKNPECDDGEVAFIKMGDKMGDGNLDGVQFVIVDVVIAFDKIASSQQLKALINNAWSKLLAMNLEVDMFLNVLSEMHSPDPITAITHFGQQDSGVFVAGNICFKDGLLLSHEEARVAVINPYFASKHCQQSMYPLIKIVPYPHVRYTIHISMWNDIYPSFFGVNEMAAKAVLCMGIMALHADKFWAGQAGLAKFPVGLAISDMAGTGKTIALSTVQALVGMNRVPLMAGSSTHVAMQTRLGLFRDGMLCVDDYVPPPGKDKQMAELVRQVFERSSRQIGGDGACQRNIEGPLMLTSNKSVCADDSAVQSRILQFQFKEMETSEKWDELQTAQSLYSCCAQDWGAMTHNGKLDKEVIGDFVNFLYQAVGVTLCRRTALWGWLLYYMCMVSWISQAKTEEIERIVSYVVDNARQAAFETSQENNMATRFFVAFAKVMPGYGSMAGRPLQDKPQECVFWHNYRTGQRLDNDDKIYMALRLSSICHVIKKLGLGYFEPKRLAQALLQWGRATGSAVPTNTCQFALVYDWPLSRKVGGMEGIPAECVALEEREIMGDLLSDPNCAAMLIDEEAFKRVMEASQHGATSHIDYKEIMIQPYGSTMHGSALPDCTYGYNLFKMLMGEDQCDGHGNQINGFIWRVAHQMPYGPFCGAGNQIFGEYDEAVAEANYKAGFGTPDEALSMDKLQGYFGYKYPAAKSLPPACTHMVYEARDDPTKGDEAIPHPSTYHPDYTGSSEGTLSDHTWFGSDNERSPPFSPRSTDSQSLSNFNMTSSPMADYQSEQVTPSPLNPTHRGSKPLGDISKLQDELHGEGSAMEEDAAFEREIEMELEIEREMEREGVLEDNYSVSIHSLNPN